MCAILEAAPRFDNALFFAKYTRQGITAGESICSIRACPLAKHYFFLLRLLVATWSPSVGMGV